MGQALAQLPAIDDQHRFNRERWDELLADRFLASLDYRIETDRFGQITMMPPPGFHHSRFQAVIVGLLRDLLAGRGNAQPACPLSTSGGVKAVDVIWISHERLRTALAGSLLIEAPEICVEVVSPSNTRPELEEKRRLYFESGAAEVWICGETGEVNFFLAPDPERDAPASLLCPDFPAQPPAD
jgi:Uma2 family endonuclease